MQDFLFVKGYKNDDTLRKSFNDLASQIFGINFESWYQKGFWTEKYQPFSFIDKNKVVANISVNKIDLLINGEQKQGLQVGTVMTHPDYRNRGLSRKLMETILAEYEEKYDVMYLFANASVLDFYPKFGFKAVEEYQLSVDFNGKGTKPTAIRKLDGTNDEDLQFIYQFASNRMPVSKRFGTENTEELLMFYIMYVFSQDIYYLEDEAAIVIYKHEEEQLHVFDIISKTKINYINILEQIAGQNTIKVVFHFTPDCKGLHITTEAYKGSEVLFVKANQDLKLPTQFKHPITTQA